MSVLLNALGIEGCAVLKRGAGYFEYPCGLKIADELVAMQNIERAALPSARLAHQCHHLLGHTSREWNLIEHIDEEPDGSKHYEAWCDCA